MSYERPRIVDVQGRTITIAHLQLPEQPYTLSTADIAAAATIWSVLDNVGFAQNDLVLLGELGAEQTEIKKVNVAVTAGVLMTLTAATFPHSAGTPLKKLLFNQWKIYGNSTNSSSGATLIATVDMQVNAPFTTYVNTGTEYTYYLVLPYDSLNTVTGDTYSDGVANATAYASNTVGSLINAALDGAKSSMSGIITHEWFLREINDYLRYITGKLKRWSFLQNFDYALGTALRGTYQYTLPTDMEDVNSNKSILGVRIGTNPNLLYKDKREWEELLDQVVLTTVRTQAAVGAVTLAITNSYDFADAGSVDVFVSGTKYTITYTGVTRSATTGILTGVPASGTGSITVIIPAATNVWQGEQEGEPTYYRVDDGSLYTWPLSDSSYDNMNVTLDYYTSRTLVNSAGDSVEGSRYDACLHWLVWKLRAQKNASGKLDMQDGDYIMFKDIVTDMVRREVSGQKFKMKPRYNFIDYGTRRPPQNV